MAYTPINYGTAPKGDDGDTQRTANQKLEAGINDLYALNRSSGGLKNKVINGNFDIWQRGTSYNHTSSASIPGYVAADRWYNNANGGSLCSVSRQAFALNQSDVPTGANWFLRCQFTSANGGGCYATQQYRIENVQRFMGKTVTLSFWAKAAATGQPICVEFTGSAGAGGTGSFNTVGVTSFALTTSWVRYSVTVTIPTTGVTAVADPSTSSLNFNIWFDSDTNNASRNNNLGFHSGTIDLAGMQLEEGAFATAFEQRPTAYELFLCQRYYESRGYFFSGYNTSGQVIYGDSPFTVKKRTSPSIFWTSLYYTNCSGINTFSIDPSRLIPSVTVTNTGLAILNSVWAADAEL